MELCVEPTDIPQLVSHALEYFAAYAAEKNIALSCTQSPATDDFPALIVDPTRVRQICLNLLSNAGTVRFHF